MGHNSSSAVFYLLGYPLSTVTKRIIAAIFIAIIWGIFRKILMFFGIFGRRSHFSHPPNFSAPIYSLIAQVLSWSSG